MIGTIGKARTVLLVTLVLLGVLSFPVVGFPISSSKAYVKMQRLCSRSLSDALYIVCRDRGYNEPFSSSEDEHIADSGPGLVEECCYHSCTFEQLERYCKPLPEGRQMDLTDDVIEESYVANLPYPPTRDLSSEQSSRLEMKHASDEIKRKVDDLKRGRHRGKGGRNVDGVCKGKADARKRHRGRHCRCRRRRLECRRAAKILRGDVKSLDNKFATSSTTDKQTSFPSVS